VPPVPNLGSNLGPSAIDEVSDY